MYLHYRKIFIPCHSTFSQRHDIYLNLQLARLLYLLLLILQFIFKPTQLKVQKCDMERYLKIVRKTYYKIEVARAMVKKRSETNSGGYLSQNFSVL